MVTIGHDVTDAGRRLTLRAATNPISLPRHIGVHRGVHACAGTHAGTHTCTEHTRTHGRTDAHTHARMHCIRNDSAALRSDAYSLGNRGGFVS